MFKSKEEKEREKQEKSEERYKKHRSYKYLEEGLSMEDKEYVKGLIDKLFSAGLNQVFFTKAEDNAQTKLLSVLIEQNWMIIKQLNEINNKLDK